MSDQAIDLNEELYDLMMTPLWYEFSIGVFDLLALIVVIFIAHYLAKRKAVRGFNMLICVYLSVLTGLVPIALSIESTTVSSGQAMLIFGSQIASSVFALFAAINCWRFVRASIANKSNQTERF